MASDREFVTFVCEQLRGAGEISSKRMFGEAAIYHQDKVVGLVCDNQFFLKPTEPGRLKIGSPTEAPPFPGASNWFLMADIDDPEFLADLVRTTAAALPTPKPKAAKGQSKPKPAAKSAPKPKAKQKGENREQEAIKAAPVNPLKVRREMVIAAMLISTFMAAVEVTVISTAMPTIIAKLGGFSLFSWAFGAYLLTQAAVTPLYGRLADSYGRKRVYLVSAGLFLVGSLLCGLAWSMVSLIFFRAMQGIGGGGLVPLASTIIGDVSEPAERPRMMGYVAGIWGISAIVGPILGAFFVNSLGWPFVFWVNLPIGLCAMAMVVRFLHEPPRTGRHEPIDAPGALLLALGVGVVMLVLVQIEALTTAQIAGFLVLGVAALLAFTWRERRVVDPLLPTYLLRRPMILVANTSAAVCGAIFLGLVPFLPAWVEGVTGGNALLAGAVLGVLCVCWTTTTITLGRHLAHLSFRPVAIIGSLALVAGSLGLLTVAAGQSIVRLCICCAFIGAGLSVNSLISTVAVQSSVARAERGRAMGLFYFCRLIGQALGAAAFGGVLNHGLKMSTGTHDIVRELVDHGRRSALSESELTGLVGTLANALHSVFILASILAVAALIVTLFIPRREQLG